MMKIIALTITLALTLGPAAAAKTDWAGLALKYKQVLVRYPTDPHARYSLAMVHAHEGQLLEGWRELESLGKHLGSNQQQFASDVISEADRILQRSPNDVLIRYRRAFALYFLGQKDPARVEFEKIVAIEPSHSWSLGYLGYGYMDRGELNRAIVLWERGIKADPNNSVLHYVLGLAYTRKGELRKAAKHFATAYKDRTLYEYVKGKGK